MSAPVVFNITVADPNSHLFNVRCTVREPDAAGQVFSLPSWLRGSYLVRDFAKHVQGLTATRAHRAVAVTRLDKRSFRCAPGRGALTLEYSVYAHDPSVRKAWLDDRRGFFNASSLCYCPVGFERSEFEIEIRRPAGSQCKDWKLATTLAAKKVGRNGFGLYRAPDYEDLIDHPVEMGPFEQLDFEVDGIPHALVLSGRYELDRERVIRDLKKICHVEREMFRQEPRLQRYLFLAQVTAGAYGGLEHRSSTALICSREDFPRKGSDELSREYRGFLGLCSHEYFHLWNVKRITAQRFLESDLSAEAYTEDLWHYEGITSYYDDLFLLRAGLFDAPTYLDIVAENATRLARNPGRALHTLADASFEAWIKYYQPDEHTPNATVSYYVKGGLAALCLDLTLRLHSDITLDDVMRGLWKRHGATGIGVPEGGLETLAQELSGLKLKPFFDRILRSTRELPLAELLGEFGVQAQQRPTQGENDRGGRSASGAALPASLGLGLKTGDTRVSQIFSDSPAARAGIAAGDQLVAIDGLRITPANWPRHLAALQPGISCTLQFFRDDELLSATVLPQKPARDTWTLSLMPGVGGETLKRRRRWLGA
ncbi:MAG TPA: PDZ domain-containing protein [Stenotrophobium sp.]|nr:PDZ domain-containing protein [Stenotrophobium sp.]